MEELKKEAQRRVGELVDDKYVLNRVLGVGGMGAVYEARHRFTERNVALKLLHPNFAKTAHYADRFSVEMKAAAAIGHRGLADVLDAGRTSDGELYAVFELLQGMDLGKAIRKGRVTPEILISTMVQILEALSVAHAKGFVHRDIKPANIFLTRTEEDLLEAKILDFGIARRVVEDGGRNATKLTQAGAVLGTPYYMSPEQMAGEEVDGRADLWSVGVVMFFALAGDLPFRAQNYGALLTEMLNAGAASLADYRSDLPGRLVRAVDRSLSRQMQDRFGSADEMAAALRSSGVGDYAQLARKPVTHTPLSTEIVRARREVVTVKKEQPKKPPKQKPKPRAKVLDVLDQIESETEKLKERQEAAPPEKKPSGGLLGGLFSKKKPDR